VMLQIESLSALRNSKVATFLPTRVSMRKYWIFRGLGTELGAETAVDGVPKPCKMCALPADCAARGALVLVRGELC